MKIVVALVLLALICFLHHNSAAPVATESLFQHCCPNSTRTPIRKGRVKHVVNVHGDCQVKAIIVTTVCDRKFCIDGNWTWAQNLVTEFKMSTTNNQAPSAPFNVLQC